MQNTREAQEFIHHAIMRMEENTPRIEQCLRELSEEEVWHRPNASSNSVGNLLLHLCGNIRQYVIASLGGKADERKRDAEFAARDGDNKTDLFHNLASTVQEATEIMRTISNAELLRVRPVQGFDMSGIGIILHVVEHYSYHTGQIAFWTKLLKNKDLGFYAGYNLNTLNAE